jgi:hypothetical protein
MADWDVVNEEIERSKIPRINWKKILGAGKIRRLFQA